MKLSDKTLTILKNFAGINTGIFFQTGKIIKTVAPTKSILATANIDEEFPTDFGIYDMTRLLGAYSLFDGKQELSYDKETFVTISEGKRKIDYKTCNPELLIRPPEGKDIQLPSEDVHVVLTHGDMDFTIRQANVLSLTEIAFTGDRENVYISALDAKNPDQTSTSTTIGETNAEFQFTFKIENLSKLMLKDYNVTISSKGLSKFSSQDGSIEYFVAVEATSSHFNA